jgi:hypothetical protein
MSYPLVQWTEENRTEALAIFYFDDGDAPEQGSWLMHSGKLENGLWKNAKLDWNVSDIEYLKRLFGVAQHLSELLEWPITDVLQLTNKSSKLKSVEEYDPIRIQADALEELQNTLSSFSIMY